MPTAPCRSQGFLLPVAISLPSLPNYLLPNQPLKLCLGVTSKKSPLMLYFILSSVCPKNVPSFFFLFFFQYVFICTYPWHKSKHIILKLLVCVSIQHRSENLARAGVLSYSTLDLKQNQIHRRLLNYVLNIIHGLGNNVRNQTEPSFPSTWPNRGPGKKALAILDILYNLFLSPNQVFQK